MGVRTFLARECALELNKSTVPMDALQKVMKEKFAESEFLISVPEKLGGAICMHYDESSGRGEFLWTHTTSSMGIAFQTTADAHATTKMSRLSSHASAVVGGGGSRLSGSADPTTTTSILVEGVPFTTLQTQQAAHSLPQVRDSGVSRQTTADECSHASSIVHETVDPVTGSTIQQSANLSSTETETGNAGTPICQQPAHRRPPPRIQATADQRVI